MSSVILYVAIALIWAGVLIPRWLRRDTSRPDIKSADHRAHALTCSLNHFCNELSDLGPGHDLADRARALADTLDRALASGRADTLASDFVTALACDISEIEVRAREISRSNARSSRNIAKRVNNKARAVAQYLGLVEMEFGGVSSDAHQLAWTLERAQGRRKAKRAAPSAAGLLTVAARLLPVADRARYAEEYLSELWDLAQCGVGRLRQLQYALRQLRSALLVSFALRSPRRRGAVP